MLVNHVMQKYIKSQYVFREQKKKKWTYISQSCDGKIDYGWDRRESKYYQ